MFGAAGVFEVGGEDGDVGLVEGGADLAAVCAVADVAVYQTGFLERLESCVSPWKIKRQLPRMRRLEVYGYQ